MLGGCGSARTRDETRALPDPTVAAMPRHRSGAILHHSPGLRNGPCAPARTPAPGALYGPGRGVPGVPSGRRGTRDGPVREFAS